MGAASGRRGRQREALSRAQVVDAAVRLLDEEGMGSVSFRRISSELGTTAMALYGHVADRRDLLLEMLDRVLAREALPEEEGGIASLLENCDWLRGFMHEHPWVIGVYMSQPVVTPHALDRMDAVLGRLQADGVDLPLAAELYGITTTFVIGFTAVEIGRTAQQGDSAHWTDFFGHLDGSRYPNLVALSPVARNMISAEGFRDGLRSLIEGLRAGGAPLTPGSSDHRRRSTPAR